jgi:hypothetical protein
MAKNGNNGTGTAIAVAEPQEAPAWLQKKEPQGIEEIGKYQNMLRLKIIQSQTDPQLQELYEVGTVILRPDNILVAKFGESFDVIPLVFWPEWVKWCDANDTEGGIFEDTSRDPNSEIAKRARNPKTWFEPYPKASGHQDEWRYRYATHLNFVVQVQSGDAAGLGTIITFAKGGYPDGAKLSGYLSRRNTPIWSNRIKLTSERRVNKQKQLHYQLSFGPADEPFIKEEMAGKLQAEHESLAAAITDNKVASQDLDSGV